MRKMIITLGTIATIIGAANIASLLTTGPTAETFVSLAACTLAAFMALGATKLLDLG